MVNGKENSLGNDVAPTENDIDPDANKSQKRNSKDGAARGIREQSIDMLDEGADRVSLVSSPRQGPSNVTHTNENLVNPELPSIDQQISKVHSLVAPDWMEEGAECYLVASQWLARVISRSSNSEEAAQAPKEAREGAIGPVDNSSIWLDVDAASDYQDEKGRPYKFLQPNMRMNQDFEIVPKEAWDLIVQWYTLAPGTPVIIRYCHNTSTNDFVPNFQWELNPPIFTILKLPDTSAGFSQKELKDKQAQPVKILASRAERFQIFLKRAKQKANIDSKTKVRVWRITGGLAESSRGGILTPAESRSASPAPGFLPAVDPGNKLVLDVNKFTQLQEGGERELLEVKDETANPNYNGKSTLSIHGLISDGVYLLEEMIGGPGGGEFVSEGSLNKARANGVAISVTKSGSTTVKDTLKPSTTTSRGTSPNPSGVMTRGRQARMGKSRGTVGLHNLGNTCYMNSALQCVRSVEELTEYFLREKYKAELNPGNPLAHNGDVAKSYARLLHEIYEERQLSSFTPRQFKNTIGKYGPSFSGYQQQDSQEFLLFLLDGLQEDLNRIHKKPYIEKPDSTDEMVNNPAALKGLADQCWDIYKKRNDSVVTDLFAGMYKSTLVCPHCDKVSIIFDPFNNLTLQLPIQNIWSKNLWIFPKRSQCFEMAVDIDKNSTWSQLASYIGTKLGLNPKKLMMAEIWQHKFYKIFESRKAISEDNVADNDQIGCFEIEDEPTNWPAPKKPKKTFTMGYSSMADDEEIPEGDSPMADKMLVSLFHRRNKTSRYSTGSKEFFALPALMTVTRQEAKDYVALQKKCLSIVETMTTRNFLAEEEGSNTEDSDTVLLNRDDSSDDRPLAESLASEDGMVEVSMTDSTSQPTEFHRKPLPSILKPGQPITFNVDTLFEMKCYAPGNEMVPLGFSSFSHDENKRLTRIDSRILSVAQEDSSDDTPTGVSKYHERLGRIGDEAEVSDEGDDSMRSTARITSNDDDSSTDDGLPPIKQIIQPPVPVSNSHLTGSRTNTRVKNTYSKKDKRKAKTPELSRQNHGSGLNSQAWSQLLHLGECIVLDWTDEGFDALFGSTIGIEDENEVHRGQPTYENPDVLSDPELEEKRKARALRKKNGVSLSDCLDEFGKSEILSENDAWYCPRCKEHRRASKTLELWKAPDILVIHLKRFSSAGRWGARSDKLDVMVDFPLDDLDLTTRLASGPDPEKPALYELIAVDNHYGGLGGGHYTACAKNFIDKQWYDYNDSMVSNKKAESVVTSAAYLLFYRRKSEGPLGGPFFEQIFTASPPNSQSNSRAPSPSSGEGKRLENSSRNGLSSAFRGAGVGHQAGGGGPTDQVMADAEDELPTYNDAVQGTRNELADDLDEGIGMEEDDNLVVGQYHGPYNYGSIGDTTWSFNQLGQTGRTNSPIAGQGDNDSVGANSNDSKDARMHALGEDDEDGLAFGTPEQRPVETDDSVIPWSSSLQHEDLPVVEIKVSEDEVAPEHTNTNMRLD